MRIPCRLAFVALFALIISVSPIVGPSFAVAAVGDILVADPGSGTVQLVPASGGAPVEFATGFTSPTMWIAADRIGNVYVAEHEDSRITKLFADRSKLPLTITTPFQPGGVQVGADGTIYVADFFGGSVYRYSESDPVFRLFAAPALARASFMALDAGGNLYVSDPLLEAVRVISPAGVDLGDFVTGFPGPAGIAFDAQGSVYIASFNSGFIERYPPPPSGPETFALFDLTASIFGIAFDASGNLYAANYAEGNILKFSPTGADLGVFASTGLVFPRDLAIIPGTAAPTVKDDCQQAGWLSFDSFKNQGACIQFLNKGK